MCEYFHKNKRWSSQTLTFPKISFCDQSKKEEVIQVCKNTFRSAFPLGQVVIIEQHEVNDIEGECWLLSGPALASLLP